MNSGLACSQVDTQIWLLRKSSHELICGLGEEARGGVTIWDLVAGIWFICWHRLEKKLKTGTSETEKIEKERVGGREVPKPVWQSVGHNNNDSCPGDLLQAKRHCELYVYYLFFFFFVKAHFIFEKTCAIFHVFKHDRSVFLLSKHAGEWSMKTVANSSHSSDNHTNASSGDKHFTLRHSFMHISHFVSLHVKKMCANNDIKKIKYFTASSKIFLKLPLFWVCLSNNAWLWRIQWLLVLFGATVLFGSC